MENSLDAGATNISISLVKGGLDLIKIADNGHGIKVMMTLHLLSK